jgi:NTP pyrophosphatase (non-canonical NTP hydrolase)
MSRYTRFHSTIEDLATDIRENCIAKGWRNADGSYDGSFGDAMALLHSEVSEAFEAWREHGTDDTTSYAQSLVCGTPPKPEGVGSEFADILIRLIDDCDIYGIDLAAEVERKLEYNRTRLYRHGGKKL